MGLHQWTSVMVPGCSNSSNHFQRETQRERETETELFIYLVVLSKGSLAKIQWIKCYMYDYRINSWRNTKTPHKRHVFTNATQCATSTLLILNFSFKKMKKKIFFFMGYKAVHNHDLYFSIANLNMMGLNKTQCNCSRTWALFGPSTMAGHWN